MDEQHNYRYVAALVTYDGTDFFGFQYQSDHQSIQGSLEIALSKFCKYTGRVVGSGRTDTGVHARGQVIAVKVDWKHDLPALQRAWNVHLPSSIAIQSITEVASEFHPRFSALSRTYCYYVTNHLVAELSTIRRSPLTDRTSLFIASPLDIEAMNEAGRHLIGIYDFAAFGQPTQGESTIRELTEVSWRMEGCAMLATTQRFLVFTVTGSSFLRHMVRNLVGTLLLVGSHKIEPVQVKEILESKRRENCAPPVPPHGLVLERVTYPAEYGIRTFA